MKKIISFLLITGILLGMQVPVFAADPKFDAPKVDVSGLTGGCSKDYLSFIKNYRDETTRQGAVTDVFKMNSCQLEDLKKVQDRLEALKKQFQAKAKACTDTQEEREQYLGLSMEVYFVRVLKPKKADYPSKADADTVKEYLDKRLATIKTEMVQRFVTGKNWISQKDFDELYQKWSETYKERIPEYVNCKSGPFAAITEDWKKLMESFGTLKELFSKKKTSTNAKSSDETVPEDVTRKENKGDVKRIGLGADSIEKDLASDFNAKNLEPALTIPEAVKASGSSDIGTVLELQQASQVQYDVQAGYNERLAHYSVLYGYNGAAIGTDLQNIVFQSTTVVDEMTQVHLPAIQVQMQKVFDKQCN